MKARILLLSMAMFSALLCSCNGKGPETVPPDPEPEVQENFFAKGADISWVTEMESKGYRFQSADGRDMECTALMKSLGMNSIRLRVWVNPKDSWCNAADVLVKAKRASQQGMKLMIDFHYSDSWADPGKQNIPEAWKSMNTAALVSAVADHTKEVLQLLKDNGIDVEWVQVGNETDTGMLWEAGRINNSNKGSDFIRMVNSGYDAVKAVYPEAKVLLHHSNAHDLAANQWFFDFMKAGGAKYDMIGLSLYPSYWSGNAYPDWKPSTQQAVANFSALHERYSKEVMLVEFGMPASQPEKAAEALTYIFDGVEGKDWFKGIFWWEPESENSRNQYDYGAFENGKPTSALAPFKS